MAGEPGLGLRADSAGRVSWATSTVPGSARASACGEGRGLVTSAPGPAPSAARPHGGTRRSGRTATRRFAGGDRGDGRARLPRYVGPRHRRARGAEPGGALLPLRLQAGCPRHDHGAGHQPAAECVRALRWPKRARPPSPALSHRGSAGPLPSGEPGRDPAGHQPDGALEEPAPSRHKAKRQQQQRLFDQVVADGVVQGVFTTTLPQEAARAIVVMCTGVASWFSPRGRVSREQLAQRYQRLALDMVGARDA